MRDSWSVSHDPTILVSHTEITDEVLDSVAAIGLQPHRVRFVPHSESDPHRIVATLNSVLGIRNVVDNLGSDHAKRLTPVFIQICAAAEMDGSAESLQRVAETARREFDRSLLSGMTMLVLYVGSVDGALPKQEFFRRLETVEHLFDLAVFVSDSDARGRRYAWQDIVGVLTRLLGCLVRLGALRDFLFDVAVRRDPRNRRVSIGLARLDVSVDTVRSLTYDRFLECLFGILFQEEQESGTAVQDIEYLSARFHSSGGSLSPAVSVLESAEGQMAGIWLKARSTEASCQTKATLIGCASESAQIGHRISHAMLAPMRYLHGRSSRSNPVEPPGTQQVTQRKSEVFQQLLRLKRIELRLKPVTSTSDAGAPFPLDVSFRDFPEGESALADRLPEIKKLASRLARTTSLKDLLSGRVTADQFVERIETLWKEQQMPGMIDDVVDSVETSHILGTLALRVAPLWPCEEQFTAKQAFIPANALCTTTVDGYKKAVGLPGQYVLIVANECTDLGFLGD